MSAVSYIVSARASSLYDGNLANNDLKLGVWFWRMEGVLRYIMCHIEAGQLNFKTGRIEVHLEGICTETPIESWNLPGDDCCPRWDGGCLNLCRLPITHQEVRVYDGKDESGGRVESAERND